MSFVSGGLIAFCSAAPHHSATPRTAQPVAICVQVQAVRRHAAPLCSLRYHYGARGRVAEAGPHLHLELGSVSVRRVGHCHADALGLHLHLRPHIAPSPTSSPSTVSPTARAHSSTRPSATLRAQRSAAQRSAAPRLPYIPQTESDPNRAAAGTPHPPSRHGGTSSQAFLDRGHQTGQLREEG